MKIKQNNSSVREFINTIEDEQKRIDCQEIAEMMRKATGKNAKMWGNSIIGFDKYDYENSSGGEGRWFRTGFSPRKQTLSIYIVDGFDKHEHLLKKLGKYKTGKSCLYIKCLDEVNKNVLNELIRESVKSMETKYWKS